MATLKMPQINSVIISGNLTKDVLFRHTADGTPVSNFTIASNRRYRDNNNKWQEDVCYIGVVAWNKLAESCQEYLRKSSAVLIEGELQSYLYKYNDSMKRTIIEIKAHRIQFLNKRNNQVIESEEGLYHDEDPGILEDISFDKFLTSEESQLLKEQQVERF
ncbi:MAG: single-stranded DNA-binding protein [Ignavibacteriales bacterium]|nr:single-stranded DNA-binding protein [Ignavibacteriales bacterium]